MKIGGSNLENGNVHSNVFENSQPKSNYSMVKYKNNSFIECPICQQELTDLEAKKDHLKLVHHYVKPFECNFCQEEFYSSLHLKVHVHFYHTLPQDLPVSALQCEYDNCKNNFCDLNEVLIHVRNQHAYQCPECPRHLQTVGGLAKHYKKAHISNTLFSCNYCGNCYKENYELMKHINWKHLDREKSSNETSGYLVEKIMHSGVLDSIKKSVSKLAYQNNGINIPCIYCRANEIFDNENDVLEHVKLMHPIQCPYCPLKMFKYPTSVRKHFKKFHGFEKPYFCHTCTLVFTDQDTVQDHMENEHIIPKEEKLVTLNAVQINNTTSEMGITCIVCGEINFESPNDLIHHRSDNHMYKCLDCPKEYKLTDSLRKHIRLTHNENIVMTCCKFCNKVFYDVSLKSSHVSSMHGDCNTGSNNSNIDLDTSNNWYQCPHCALKYLMVNDLKKHARINHNVEIMTCPNCPMVFTDINSRNVHVSSHDVDRNDIGNKILKSIDNFESMYHCPKCMKSYNIAKSLRKHCRHQHGLTICFCKPCHMVFTTIFQKNQHEMIMHTVKNTVKKDEEVERIVLFPSTDGLNLNHGAAEQITKCRSCFKNPENTNKSTFECPICDINLGNYKTKNEHFKIIHPDLKTFRCDHCKDLFTSENCYFVLKKKSDDVGLDIFKDESEKSDDDKNHDTLESLMAIEIDPASIKEEILCIDDSETLLWTNDEVCDQQTNFLDLEDGIEIADMLPIKKETEDYIC